MIKKRNLIMYLGLLVSLIGIVLYDPLGLLFNSAGLLIIGLGLVGILFGYKWKEAIGQSLHYAEATNKKAAILLIKRKQSNKDYYNEMMNVINKYDLPIKVFLIDE